MKLRIAICDDLPSERRALADLIREYGAKKQLSIEIRLFSSGDELLERYQPGLFHMIFLDIYMPGTDGEATARQIRRVDPFCCLIFATTSEEHGLVSYEVQASDYLVKPFRPDEVADAMDWCVETVSKTCRTLTIPVENGTVLLELREIMYIEIQDHLAWIHTEKEVLTTRRGLDSLEEEINSEDFLRCHRSFLVNLNYVKWYDKKTFCLTNGEVIPIGSTGRNQVRDRYMDWSFIKAWENKQ